MRSPSCRWCHSPHSLICAPRRRALASSVCVLFWLAVCLVSLGLRAVFARCARCRRAASGLCKQRGAAHKWFSNARLEHIAHMCSLLGVFLRSRRPGGEVSGAKRRMENKIHNAFRLMWFLFRAYIGCLPRSSLWSRDVCLPRTRAKSMNEAICLSINSNVYLWLPVITDSKLRCERLVGFSK